MNSFRNIAAIISTVGAIVGAAAFATDLVADRAFVSIERIEFEPAILRANARARVTFTLKNVGRHSATIEGMATDRLNKPPSEIRYHHASISRVEIPADGELRIISDLANKPLILTRSEIDSLKKDETRFIVIGFVKYSDFFSWPLGTTVLGFCYVWDPRDTSIGNFSTCAERQYTYRYRYWIHDRISFYEVPMTNIGTQAITPTAATMRAPQFPPHRLEIQPASKSRQSR